MASVLDSNALVTWEVASLYLEEISPEKVNYVERLINAASGMANRATGRLLKARTYTSYLDSPRGSRLFFPEYPVHAITTINDDENRAWSSTDTAWSSTEYQLDRESGILDLLDDSFCGAKKALKVVYNAGYGTTTTGSTVDNATIVPWDLQVAVLETTKFLWNRFSARGVGIRSQSADGMNIGFEITMPMNAVKILEGYRRREHRD